MAHHADPSSATRIAVPPVPMSYRTPPKREAYADQGTLIMDADEGLDALAAAQAIVASRAPSSVRPPLESLPEVVFERTGISHHTASRPKPTKIDSSLVMLVMGAIAMIAAVASIAQMTRPVAQPVATASAPAKVAAAAQPVAPPPAAPVVAPPVATTTADAIDVDEPAPAKAAPVVKHVTAAPAPVVKAAVETKPAAEKKAAPKATADDKKTLEQLLDELGEEQLKR